MRSAGRYEKGKTHQGTWIFRESHRAGAKWKRLCERLTDDARGAKPPLSQMAPSTTVKGVYAAKFLNVLMRLLSL